MWQNNTDMVAHNDFRQIAFNRMDIFSKSNTQALKGFAAIFIFIFHILLGYNLTPFFNMWGAFFVTVFLILSGYGLEESYKQNGLAGYWQKRMRKVILPFAFFVCAYNYIFSFFSPEVSMHSFLDELLYVKPIFWFVFFILKCYLVYWIGTRFLGKRLRLLFFLFCGLVCLNMQAPCGHLEAEQSFSFLAGILLSVNKHRVEAFTNKRMMKMVLFLLLTGFVFLCLKTIPPLHALKGSIAYNYMLCPFRLSIGLAFIPLLSMLRLGRTELMRVPGKYSLEIYIAHIPFIGMITDAKTTIIFLAYSAVGFVILLVYRRFVEKKLNTVEVLFIMVNVLFVAKYSARVSENAALSATLLATLFYYILLRLVIPNYICRVGERGAWIKKIVFGACLFAFLGMIVAQNVIDPYSIQVDRWSALHFPIQNFLSGNYPYAAHTHLGGSASPFPVWQIVHIPFYLLGNVGLSVFAAMALFLWSCYKVQGSSVSHIVALLMCSSVVVWYEVVVRSDLITNFLLLAALINFVFNSLNQQWVEEKRWWIACAVGSMACTRFLVLIPIALLLLPYFIRMSFRRQISTVLLTVFVFALTFVPFALLNWQEFFYSPYSPWALQTRQGNFSDFCLFVPLAIYLALNHKAISVQYYRNSALMLAVFVSVSFVHNMYLAENWNLFSSTYDITYYSTVLPFCLLAIGEKDWHVVCK